MRTGRTSMMRAPECRAFADQHGLIMISIADMIRFRRRTESLVTKVAEATIEQLEVAIAAVGKGPLAL